MVRGSVLGLRWLLRRYLGWVRAKVKEVHLSGGHSGPRPASSRRGNSRSTKQFRGQDGLRVKVRVGSCLLFMVSVRFIGICTAIVIATRVSF